MASAIVERARQGMAEIMICRIAAPPHAERWTFPNILVEPGEAPEAAVRRLFPEFSGLEADILHGQPPFDQPWDGVIYRWRYFFCSAAVTDVRNERFTEIRWVPRPSLREYEFDPVSQHVVDWLLEEPTE